MKTSLCFIYRDNENTIQEMLDSSVEWFDEVVAVDTGCQDGTTAMIEQHCESHGVALAILRYEDPCDEKWVSNFSDARRVGWEAATGDYLVWLDTDDTLVEIGPDGAPRPGGETLRQLIWDVCEDVTPSKQADCIMMRYDYAFDGAGNCTTRQPRIRVARKGFFDWKEPVHEVLFPNRPSRSSEDPYSLKTWVSHRGAVNKKPSAERNLWIIGKWAEDNKMTPRLWSGKTDALVVLERYEEAVVAAEEGLHEAQKDDFTRYRLLMRGGDAIRRTGDRNRAMDWYQRAERLNPTMKAPYMAVAETLFEQGKYEECLIWCQKCDMADGDRTSLTYNPTAGTSIVMHLRAQCLFELGEYAQSAEMYKKLAELHPNVKEVQERLAAINHGLDVELLYECWLKVYDSVDQEQQGVLVDMLPEELQHYPIFSGLRRPARPKDRKTIVIHCGVTHNEWDDRSIQTGTGGSEESVIFLGRELTKLGYYVEVYGNPIDAETHVDEWGVCWMPAHSWNPHDKADVFIAWRYPRLVQLADNCDQRWIWIQDIPRQEWYTPELVASIEGVLCISEFQSRSLGQHGLEKWVHTANGLDEASFIKTENNPREFIYASSPDRGLVQLLEEWPEIQKATGGMLHIFYGFRDVFMREVEKSKFFSETKMDVERLLEENKETVINHGMVGQPELHSWFAKCGWWLYPTSFEEAFCITAAKAAAYGAIPITSRNPESSLPEVCGDWDLGPEPPSTASEVLFRDDPDWRAAWVQRVIEVVKDSGSYNDHREKMVAEARERFPWRKVADQWHSLFLERAETPALPPLEEEDSPLGVPADLRSRRVS